MHASLEVVLMAPKLAPAVASKRAACRQYFAVMPASEDAQGPQEYRRIACDAYSAVLDAQKVGSHRHVDVHLRCGALN